MTPMSSIVQLNYTEWVTVTVQTDPDSSVTDSDLESSEKSYALFVLVPVSILGTTGNILLLITIAVGKELRSYTDAFILNITAMNLIITSMLLPSGVPVLMYGENVYPPVICQILGIADIVICTGVVSCHTSLAVNRCVYVLHQNIYTRVFTRLSVSVILLCCWLYGALLGLPIILGWGGLAMCTYDPSASLSHLIFILTFAVFVPMIVTYAAYGRIACALQKSRRRVAGHVRRVSKHQNILTIFVMSSLFTVFWIPYTVTAILESVGVISSGYSNFGEYFGMSISSINFFVLVLSSQKYRNAFRCMICCGCNTRSSTLVHSVTPIATVS